MSSRKNIFHYSIYLLIFISFGYSDSSSLLKYSYGLHDFTLDDSHTIGLNGGFSYEDSFYGKLSFDGFVEYDEEEHDSDHIPIWFKGKYRFKSEFRDVNSSFKINGVGDINWKMNTVSGIEQTVDAGVGLESGYDNGAFFMLFRVLYGLYYLEYDDDTPKDFGYNRRDLSDGVIPSISLIANVGFRFNESIDFSIEFGEWREDDVWLRDSMNIELSYHHSSWIENQKLRFSIDGNYYNISRYSRGDVDILPWDRDVLFRLTMETPF